MNRRTAFLGLIISCLAVALLVFVARYPRGVHASEDPDIDALSARVVDLSLLPALRVSGLQGELPEADDEGHILLDVEDSSDDPHTTLEDATLRSLLLGAVQQVIIDSDDPMIAIDELLLAPNLENLAIKLAAKSPFSGGARCIPFSWRRNINKGTSGNQVVRDGNLKVNLQLNLRNHLKQADLDRGVWQYLNTHLKVTHHGRMWILRNDGSWDNATRMFDVIHYRKKNGTTAKFHDLVVMQQRIQQRARNVGDWRGTVEYWKLNGCLLVVDMPNTTRRVAPNDHLPRAATAGKDARQFSSTGLKGWNTVKAQKKSSGFVMSAPWANIHANRNTGVNGGDKVLLAVQGALTYEKTDGTFDSDVHAPGKYLRICFKHAQGGGEDIYKLSDFPRVFTRRGSLYFFVELPKDAKPMAQQLLNKGGYVVHATMVRDLPTNPGDQKTKYETTNGLK